MIFNNTEIEQAGAVTEYIEKPSWVDTFKASAKNFQAVSLTTSEFNYANDEKQSEMKVWKDTDPKNSWTYDQIGTLPSNVTEKLEALYEAGNKEAIRDWNTMGTGETFLKFKELQKQYNLKGLDEIYQNAKAKSLKDYKESGEVVQDSDYTSASILGTMWGALHDPVTIATLPLGTWKTGGSIAMNAARAFGEEALIETAAQAVILPVTYAYKQEIGLKTTLKEEAYNAVAGIAAAGTLRGAGSAAFDTGALLLKGKGKGALDLSEAGIEELKAKDPSLGEDYENMVKSQATQDVDEHIDNLYKAEFNEESTLTITDPNETGVILDNARGIPEDDPIIVAQARMEGLPPDTLDIDLIQAYTGGKGDVNAKAAAELDPILKNIEGDYEGPAIRGMLDTEGTLSKLEVGDTYETRGVTSIAKDKGTADTFVNRAWDEGATGEKVYVTFDSFQNKPVNLGLGNKVGLEDPLDLTKTGKAFLEDEVVIPSGRNFEVISKTKKGDETHLLVKEVDSQAVKAEKDMKPDPADTLVQVGTDDLGAPISKSYKELQAEADNDAMWINKAKDCFL